MAFQQQNDDCTHHCITPSIRIHERPLLRKKFAGPKEGGVLYFRPPKMRCFPSNTGVKRALDRYRVDDTLLCMPCPETYHGHFETPQPKTITSTLPWPTSARSGPPRWAHIGRGVSGFELSTSSSGFWARSRALFLHHRGGAAGALLAVWLLLGRRARKVRRAWFRSHQDSINNMITNAWSLSGIKHSFIQEGDSLR